MIEKGQKLILGVSGAGVFSRMIQSATTSEIPTYSRWSHVAACFYHWALCDWVVVESIYPGGVRLLSLTEWLNKNWRKPIVEAFNYDYLSPSSLLSCIGQAYGNFDIVRLGRKSANFVVGTNKNYDGLICSELLALSDNGNMAFTLNRKPHNIVPVDIQEMGVKQYEILDFRASFSDAESSGVV